MKYASAEYKAKEEAVQRQPAELYHIWRDGGEDWYYTSGDVPIVYGGKKYVPATLSRDSTSYDSQLQVSTMRVQVGYLEDPALEFIATNPIEILWISITKMFRDQDPIEVGVIFIGQILTVSFKGSTAEVNCVGFEHFLKQTVPHWRYQLTCNHAVFDSKCALSKSSYKETTVITLDATKTQLTSADFSGYDDGYFIGGEVIFGIESRTIIDHVGSVITIMYKMRELVTNDSVDAYPGCDGVVETCRDKYDNILNFLGFPFIPIENPAIRTP